MADLSITPANVKAGANAIIQRGTSGATVTAGQVVYPDSSDGKFKLGDSDNASAAVKSAGAIALHGASDGQPLAVQTGGEIAIGATLVPGTAYYLSGTPGGIQPAADLASEDVILIGIAKSSSILALKIFDSGVTIA